MFAEHEKLVIKLPSKAAYEVCDMDTRFKCSICDKRICLFDEKKLSESCITAYHNNNCFGLSKIDSVMHGLIVKNWSATTATKFKSNGWRVETLKEEMKEE